MSSRSWAGATAGSLIPCRHAKFLGPELLFPRVHGVPDGAHPYRKRLLVVMPNNFGFNYPAHNSSKA
jgi:hypothetical protein